MESTIEKQIKPEIDNDHPVHELISKRWSGRAFSSKGIEEEVLFSLFEAARWSASCYNDQPWYFLVARKKEEHETFQKMLQSIKPSNREWAQNAPVLILALARDHFKHNNEENKHAWYDLGLAVANFTIQATLLDLNLHQMAGFNSKLARDLLNIPSEYSLVTITALGYRDEPDYLSEINYQKEIAPQKRKKLKEFVFCGEWQKNFGRSE